MSVYGRYHPTNLAIPATILVPIFPAGRINTSVSPMGTVLTIDATLGKLIPLPDDTGPVSATIGITGSWGPNGHLFDTDIVFKGLLH